MTGSSRLVMKFGGTSVGSVEAMHQAARLVQEARQQWEEVIVVTSALSGVTDLLIQSAQEAAQGNLTKFHSALEVLNLRHTEMAQALVHKLTCRGKVLQQMEDCLTEFTNLCQAVYVLGEISPRALDAVASLGERLSVRLLAAAIQDVGIRAEWVESTRLVITDDHFTNALPDMAATTSACKTVLTPLLQAGCVPVVTGFLGATPNGIVTTLGRGGSDYSASILAVALHAAEVWIWTDVDGVMTADPRLVKDARTIPVISYREVAEMAHFGAKVLHPKSIHPVIEAGIALRVCNTFNPHGPDTHLVDDLDHIHDGAIHAIAVIRGLQLVTLSGRGMLGVPGVAARILSAAATTGISVPLIIESTSEQAICFPAPKASIHEVIHTLQTHLSNDFQRGDIDRIVASDDVDIITVVCPGLRTTAGVAGQIFGVLGDAGINVLGISFGASDVSINLIVSAQDTATAVQSLHTLVK